MKNRMVMREAAGLELHRDWIPDKGVLKWVRDTMRDRLGIENIDKLPRHWLPLVVTGTMDWIFKSGGWWIFENAGIFDSNEPFNWVFSYEGYDFEPDELNVFRDLALVAEGEDGKFFYDEGTWYFVSDNSDFTEKFEVDENGIPEFPTAVFIGKEIFEVLQVPDLYYFKVNVEGGEVPQDKEFLFQVFQDQNLFEERNEFPGLQPEEMQEAFPWVVEMAFLPHAGDASRNEQVELVPPKHFIQMSMWATFLWILSDNGKDWFRSEDPTFNHIYDFGVAYRENDKGTLLPPDQVEKTQRSHFHCSHCDSRLICVEGAFLNAEWVKLCIHCMVRLSDTEDMDTEDERIFNPPCPHLNKDGPCPVTCPHSGMDTVKRNKQAREELKRRGKENTDRLREARRLGHYGRKLLGGRSIQEINEMYDDEDWR